MSFIIWMEQRKFPTIIRKQPVGKRSSTKGCAGTVRTFRCQYHHECLCPLHKKKTFPYFPYDYLIRAKIRENTYHFTNEQAKMPVKREKLAGFFGKPEFIILFYFRPLTSHLLHPAQSYPARPHPLEASALPP